MTDTQAASSTIDRRDQDWGETLDRLRGFIAARVGDPEVAADITQDVLVRSIASGALDRVDNLAAWLYRVGPQRRHRPLPDPPRPRPATSTWTAGPTRTRPTTCPTTPPASSPAVCSRCSAGSTRRARDALTRVDLDGQTHRRGSRPARHLRVRDEVTGAARPTRAQGTAHGVLPGPDRLDRRARRLRTEQRLLRVRRLTRRFASGPADADVGDPPAVGVLRGFQDRVVGGGPVGPEDDLAVLGPAPVVATGGARAAPAGSEAEQLVPLPVSDDGLVDEAGTVTGDDRLDHSVQGRLGAVARRRVPADGPAKARQAPRVTLQRTSRASVRSAPLTGSRTETRVSSSSHAQLPLAKPQPSGASRTPSPLPPTACVLRVATEVTSPPRVPAGDRTSRVPPGLMSRSSYVGSVSVGVSRPSAEMAAR